MTESSARKPVDAPKGRLPLDPPSAPLAHLPKGACDAHLHMFGELKQFPLAQNIYERPPDGTLTDWLDRLDRQMTTLGLERAVLVGSVAYREDNSLLLEALRRGGEAFRGIALVGPNSTSAELSELRTAGVRGVRINMRHPGALDHRGLKKIAPLLRDADLHVQVLLDSQDQFDAIESDLRDFGLEIVVDHMASITPQLEQPYSNRFLRALEEGWLFVKLSAPYRIESAPYHGSERALKTLLGTRPDRIVWGTDWPYVIYDGPAPDAGRLVDWVFDACTSEQVRLIFSETPAALYFDGSKI